MNIFLFKFSIFIPGNYQEGSETALSDEALLGRVERDAGRRRVKGRKKKGAGKRKKGRGRKKKTRGKKKRGKKTRGKKGRKAQGKCGRQTGL